MRVRKETCRFQLIYLTLQSYIRLNIKHKQQIVGNAMPSESGDIPDEVNSERQAVIVQSMMIKII